MSTIYLHQMRDPYSDYDFRNTEEDKEDELCPKCMELIEECECDYYAQLEEEILNQSKGTVNHHFDGILAMVKPSHLK